MNYTYRYQNEERRAAAMAIRPTAYDVKGDDNAGDMLATTTAFLYLALDARQNDAPTVVLDRVMAHVRALVGEGEPYFDAHPYWNYPILTAALAVVRRTPSIWSALTEDEQARVDLIMRGFTALCSFATDDRNDYRTGPGMTGNFCKSWNPNYRIANVANILFSVAYFGSPEAVNEVLATFDYDAYMAKAEAFGFKRWVKRWSTPAFDLPNGERAPGAKELLTRGGAAYFGTELGRNGQEIGAPAGIGVGVCAPYTYHGNTLDNYKAIWEDLLDVCYQGGPVVSRYGKNEDGTYKAYILDGTTSVVEGQDGMMLEFASGDAQGPRSSCAYTCHDFVMVSAITAALDTLGMYSVNDPANESHIRKMIVGNDDTIYKLEHGYMSYSLGHGYESHEEKQGSYPIWKSLWNETYHA